jgi:hypothetical protein
LRQSLCLLILGFLFSSCSIVSSDDDFPNKPPKDFKSVAQIDSVLDHIEAEWYKVLYTILNNEEGLSRYDVETKIRDLDSSSLPIKFEIPSNISLEIYPFNSDSINIRPFSDTTIVEITSQSPIEDCPSGTSWKLILYQADARHIPSLREVQNCNRNTTPYNSLHRNISQIWIFGYAINFNQYLYNMDEYFNYLDSVLAHNQYDSLTHWDRFNTEVFNHQKSINDSTVNGLVFNSFPNFSYSKNDSSLAIIFSHSDTDFTESPLSFIFDLRTLDRFSTIHPAYLSREWNNNFSYFLGLEQNLFEWEFGHIPYTFLLFRLQQIYFIRKSLSLHAKYNTRAPSMFELTSREGGNGLYFAYTTLNDPITIEFITGIASSDCRAFDSIQFNKDGSLKEASCNELDTYLNMHVDSLRQVLKTEDILYPQYR